MNLEMKTVDAVVSVKRMRPVLLPGLCLLFAGASFAQTNGDRSHVMSPSQLRHAAFSSGGSMPGEKNAAPKPAPKPASSTTPAKGTHEGIQVHGYWVIEVKNPDGTVTARREFENSIQQSGAAFLASLLAGNNSSGGLSILLNGAQTSLQWSTAVNSAGTKYNYFLFASAEAGPCNPFSYHGDVIHFQLDGGSGATCIITGGSSVGGQTFLAWICSSYGVPCSTNLAASAPSLGGYYLPPTSQLVLNGSATATQAGTGNVNDVETIFTLCNGIVTPNSCLNNGGTSIADGPYIFTERTLDGLGSDPQPVPYSVGQTISVTVTISFQ